jgi:hypothetical protein
MLTGAGSLGHPTEFMTLNKASDEPEVCNHCSLRYIWKKRAHH